VSAIENHALVLPIKGQALTFTVLDATAVIGGVQVAVGAVTAGVIPWLTSRRSSKDAELQRGHELLASDRVGRQQALYRLAEDFRDALNRSYSNDASIRRGGADDLEVIKRDPTAGPYADRAIIRLRRMVEEITEPPPSDGGGPPY